MTGFNALLRCRAKLKGGSPTPTPGVSPMALGVNVAASVYYNTERTYANLAQGSGGWKDTTNGYGSTPASKLGPTGSPIVDGQALFLNPPQPVWNGEDVAVVITWTGLAIVKVDGDVRASSVAGSNTMTVTWPGRNGSALPSLSISPSAMSSSNPFDNLDVREPGLQTVGIFDKRLIDDLKVYSVLRYLDWSNTNGNPADVTWAKRTTLTKSGIDGVPVEIQVDLANAANADPWFALPWNADEDYVRQFATLVRDRLSPSRRAYFELSNEVWNFQFPVARQATDEGYNQVPPLSTDYYSNTPKRYAQKSIWFHQILADVFSSAPSRLVRVASAQHDNTFSASTIMAFPGLADNVDALATAPYFGNNFFSGTYATPTTADLPALFARLESQRQGAIAKAKDNKAIATRYGKRYIAYEAGQHIIAGDSASAEAKAMNVVMQRDPEMYQIYKRYLADWQTGVGDLETIYSHTGTISIYGSWGIREYGGQPLSASPKRRAVLETVASLASSGS